MGSMLQYHVSTIRNLNDNFDMSDNLKFNISKYPELNETIQKVWGPIWKYLGCLVRFTFEKKCFEE
jgi:hypothetical protein